MSVPPLHPVLPALVEVYVNSILMPAGKSPQENTNQPISEDEIRAVFSNLLNYSVSVFTINSFTVNNATQLLDYSFYSLKVS